MNDLDVPVFKSLFTDTCEKCFGYRITSPLSEPDSKHLSNKIFDQTGLVIGAKSLKNYSLSIVPDKNKETKRENPSIATLDTLARYVLDAPYTDEIKRQENESDYPYWFQYRSRYTDKLSRKKNFIASLKKSSFLYIFGLAIVFGFYIFKVINEKEAKGLFTDNFNSVTSDSLLKNGWFVRSADTAWWNKRNVLPGHLTLYSLKGDNWPLGENRAAISNLLMRKIDLDCFMVEIHLTDFIPGENWQQAGILLSEDSTFTGKMIRLSISYNDFFGGYKKSPEIIIQAISSSESGSESKPEEIAHFTLFSLEPANKSIIDNNLANSALKIEKKGNHFRFLYTTGSSESFTFKEVANGDYNIIPRFVSIFSMKGWSDNENIIPAHFDSFSMVRIDCSKGDPK
jgi:hypothetical protein